MNVLRVLADPGLVAKFQRLCGIELEKPPTCDQQTQTRRHSPDSDDADSSSGEHEEHPPNLDKNHQISNHSSNKCSRCDQTESDGYLVEMRHRCIVTDSMYGNSSPTVFQAINTNSNVVTRCDGTSKGGIKNNRKLNVNHIIQTNSRIHSKGDIHECHGNSDDDRPVNSDIPIVPPTNQVVRIKYKSLLYLAHFGAFLGNEEFYLTFFPFTIWNLDCLVVRQMVPASIFGYLDVRKMVAMLWCVSMYVGQATKDYLRWPRPPCPPVIRLETHYLQEYSMPSTHAMAGTAIPLFLAYLMVERYQVPTVVAGTIAVLWFSLTCLSRLYLGVHTVLDLVAGFILAVFIFFTFKKYVDDYDLYQQTHPFAAVVILFTALALCTVCYPSSHKNSSKGDAVQIVGAVAGSSIGCWLGYQLGFMHEPEILRPYTLTLPTLDFCGLALLRFLTGLVVLFIIYTISRLSSIRFFSHMYGLEKPDKTFPSVMTAYKFTTYLLVGSAITLIVPLLHMHLGIHRTALFYEVL